MFLQAKNRYDDPSVRCGSCGTFKHRFGECPHINVPEETEVNNGMDAESDSHVHPNMHYNSDQTRTDIGQWADVEDEGNEEDEANIDENIMVGLANDVLTEVTTSVVPLIVVMSSPTEA
ncbi:hypothetical protein NE237_028752 [Protea cynaroides]|uniref:Uncharacterized protein n=1 Tax=Protea cynaroides TaxID=273540 RepID=A0A9Q0JVF8_9MAGN|nr:hypothetical protein NE237_028752 [Protea cynaroides]